MKDQDARVAKIHFSYTVDEVIKLYGCHRNTVYNWVAEGLRQIDEHHPLMFHGSTLNEFQSARKAANKHPCGPGELYCMKCREARIPYAGAVDFPPRPNGTWNVSALCPSCRRIMNRVVSRAQLPDFEVRYSVTYRTAINALG